MPRGALGSKPTHKWERKGCTEREGQKGNRRSKRSLLFAESPPPIPPPPPPPPPASAAMARPCGPGLRRGGLAPMLLPRTSKVVPWQKFWKVSSLHYFNANCARTLTFQNFSRASSVWRPVLYLRVLLVYPRVLWCQRCLRVCC